MYWEKKDHDHKNHRMHADGTLQQRNYLIYNLILHNSMDQLTIVVKFK